MCVKEPSPPNASEHKTQSSAAESASKGRSEAGSLVTSISAI